MLLLYYIFLGRDLSLVWQCCTLQSKFDIGVLGVLGVFVESRHFQVEVPSWWVIGAPSCFASRANVYS